MIASRGNAGQAGWSATRASVLLLAALLAVSISGAAQATANTATGAGNASSETAVLDRVVAVVGEQTILASDVDEEMRFAAFQPAASSAGDNTLSRALDRVIDRMLIDEQRVLQPGVARISGKDVEHSITDLREQIPACVPYKCKTDAGWQAFLAAQGFSPSQVEERVRERLAILKFIDLRFGVAARVPNAAVRKYFDDVLTPALQRNKAAIPDFNAVAPSIREVLRQQQVSDMVDQQLRGLRSEEHVRILDSAYAEGKSR